MLDLAGYRADGDSKQRWYAEHGILPFEDGGGSDGVLVCSTERHDRGGIDALAIEQLARLVFQVAGSRTSDRA